MKFIQLTTNTGNIIYINLEIVTSIVREKDKTHTLISFNDRSSEVRVDETPEEIFAAREVKL